MASFCANCGTEVDGSAAFCPTCGQPLDDDVQAPPQAGLPQAPGWSDDSEATRPEPRVDPVASTAPPEPERVDDWRTAGAHQQQPPRERTEPAPRQQIDLPISWPVTLSGWLIGIGAVVGVLSMFIPWLAFGAGGFGGFGSFVNILFLVVLLGIAATIFFATTMPAVPHQRLAILGVSLVGLGIGLDRIGLGAPGVGAVLFFMAMLAMAVGAIMLELGRDRPLAAPRRGP